MKTIVTMLTAVFTALLFGTESKAQGTLVSDTVVMGGSYVNEVYYKISDGTKYTTNRILWDIAFRTKVISSSIMTNDGVGVVLYTYPKADSTGWATLDTTGLSGWAPMYNDQNDWENGAFSRNASGYPDYGWGKYNEVTHNLIGDSLFVIKLRDGSFKKLRIIEKFSVEDIYRFRFANLDGTGEQDIMLNLKPDTAKNFIGYSLQTNERVDFEPVRQSWDLLFTKYVYTWPDNSSYIVTGVLCNQDVSTKRFAQVPLDYSDWGPGKWDSTRASIGYDWKMVQPDYTYKVVDSLLFFVKPVKPDIYKLYFTSFAGTTTGVISFLKGKIAGVGVDDEQVTAGTLNAFPNPATDFITIFFSAKSGEDVFVSLTDLSGRQLRSDRPEGLADGKNSYVMDVKGIKPGVYFVSVTSSSTRSVLKVIIRH
ncbi:MAG: T9SS type A sorting domain-containing protein [bacterium]